MDSGTTKTANAHSVHTGSPCRPLRLPGPPRPVYAPAGLGVLAACRRQAVQDSKPKPEAQLELRDPVEPATGRPPRDLGPAAAA